MTALLTLEHVHHLGTMFTQPNYYPSAVDSQIGLVPGERMSVHDLLLALMLPSADDAAEDLAYNVGHGSVARFVGMMNARARELGLRHTHYTTPIGLDTPGNYSSAADLVEARELRPRPLAILRSHRRAAQRGAAIRRPRPLCRQPQRPRRQGIVDRRRQDRTHRRCRLRSGRIRASKRHDAGQRRARDRERGGAGREHNGAARLRIRQFPSGDARHAGARCWPVPRSSDRPGAHAALIAAPRTSRGCCPRRDRVQIQIRRAAAADRAAAAATLVVGTAVVLAGGRPVARIPLLLARALPAVSGLTRRRRLHHQAADAGGHRDRARRAGRARGGAATPGARRPG